MYEPVRGRSIRLLAAALLALTTIVVGFAHRPLRLEARGYPADFSAWMLPDGTLPELCHFDDLGGRSHDSDGANTPCDACLLAGAPGLGAVADLVLAPPDARVAARLASDTSVLVGAPPTAPRSRGPPSVAGT